MNVPRFVVDTNVVFEGLTKQGGASGFLVDGWLVGLFQPFVTNALAYEYADVLSRKLNSQRLRRIYPLLQRMLTQAQFIPIHYSWRPISGDPGDEHVIDCAMNAGATLVTWNIRDFRSAQAQLGLVVMTPVEAVTLLADV